jgi:uncharacterized membrane protein YgdD (TMEM256/DUF423 family)
MRLIHICAALTGAAAFTLLALAHHAHGGEPNFSFVVMAALAQISAAASGLTIAQHTSRLAAIAAAMILLGANLFAGVIYLSAFYDNHPLHALAPIGGGLLILGWLTLAFSAPAPKQTS